MTPATAARIRRWTTPAAAPLVPELSLRFARDARGIWQDVSDDVTDPAALRPFWAFAWPGGQAKARFLLDNPDIVAGRRVLDIGSGSGICALAAKRAGARSVVANDIDPLALAVIAMNARDNDLAIDVDGSDLLDGQMLDADVVILSDVVYEPELQVRVRRYVEIARRAGVRVYFSDRSTARLPTAPLVELARYEAQVFPVLEETHIETGLVWRLT